MRQSVTQLPNIAAEPQRTAQLRITKRSLPHWELGGSTYFLTYRCTEGFTLRDDIREIVLNNWQHWDNRRYLLHTAVVMPDHVHVLLTPLMSDATTWFTLETILHTNKSFTAHEINLVLNRSGSVWQT